MQDPNATKVRFGESSAAWPGERNLMSRILTKSAEVRAESRSAKRNGRVVGFVPTMGALHDGHARLIEQARKESGLVVVSIFVNPTQFGPLEDYSCYPRTFEADLARCESAGADLIFAPDVPTLYPRQRDAMTFVEVPGLSDILEGASRPGHFRGVVTIVCKLFGIVEPDLAFFGAKDYQQQLVIRHAVADLDLAVEVRTVQTVRDSDGLALSSRNRYLDLEQRRASGVLWRALSEAKAAVEAGERDANRVRQILTRTIESERAAEIDYAEVADAETLERLDVLAPRHRAVGLLAVRFGTTRLIDNAYVMD